MSPVAHILGLIVAGGLWALPASAGLQADEPAQRPGAPAAAVAPARAVASAAPATPAEQGLSLTLDADDRSHTNPKGPAGKLSALATVAGSLAVVLGLFLLAAWAMRRAAPGGSLRLPGDVFEVLGRAPLANRQQVQLLRCGHKLLLVSVTPAGAETLTEVTEAAEVDRLAGLCRQAHSPSAATAFRQIFEQWAPRHPARRSPRQGEAEAVAAVQETGPSRRRWEDDHV